MIPNTETTDLYFGYGSNLDMQDWEKWCTEHGRDPNSVEVLPGIYFLPDYELAFDYYSHGRGGGALDVVEKRGHVVAGKLFKVNEEGWKALDAKEGAPNYYERKTVQVFSEDGKTRKDPGKSHSVITYVVTSDKKTREHQKPTEEYVEAVLRGYDSHGITEKYPWAKKQLLESSLGIKVKSAVNHIFTYGTLREGEERSHILAEFSEKMYKDCKVIGNLISLGSYPGLIRTMICENCGKEVIGEIHYSSINPDTIKDIENLKYSDSSLYCYVMDSIDKEFKKTSEFCGSDEKLKLISKKRIIKMHQDYVQKDLKIRKEFVDELVRDNPPGITCEKCDEEIEQHYGFVMGEIHHTPKIQNALKTLDQIEGFRGYEEKNSLFDRILVQSDDKLCWTYQWAGSLDDGRIILSGRWRKK